jgi:glycosyltransferase involved in cell wall biosynthesis
MRDMTCSIVIATHQRLPMLREAVQSALAQRDVDLEVIVVENGSTDGTQEYLASVDDPRLRALVFDHPLGGTAARNEGLRAARGEWVGFLDDDDVWAPDKLKAQLAAVQQQGRFWAYTGCIYMDAACEVVGGSAPEGPEVVMERLPQRYAIPAGISSMLWRAEALDQGGLLEPELTYMVDWDLSQRLARLGPPAAVREPLVAYRQHGANMSVRAHSYVSELNLIDARFADLRRGRPLDIAAVHRNAGSEFLRAGMRRQALKSYWRAVSLGDRGAVLRAAAAVVPPRLWPMLRRRVLSDEAWLQRGEEWLKHHRETPEHRGRSTPVAAQSGAT